MLSDTSYMIPLNTSHRSKKKRGPLQASRSANQEISCRRPSIVPVTQSAALRYNQHAYSLRTDLIFRRVSLVRRSCGLLFFFNLVSKLEFKDEPTKEESSRTTGEIFMSLYGNSSLKSDF